MSAAFVDPNVGVFATREMLSDDRPVIEGSPASSSPAPPAGRLIVVAIFAALAPDDPAATEIICSIDHLDNPSWWRRINDHLHPSEDVGDRPLLLLPKQDASLHRVAPFYCPASLWEGRIWIIPK